MCRPWISSIVTQAFLINRLELLFKVNGFERHHLNENRFQEFGLRKGRTRNEVRNSRYFLQKRFRLSLFFQNSWQPLAKVSQTFSLVCSLHFATASASSNFTDNNLDTPSLPIVTPYNIPARLIVSRLWVIKINCDFSDNA